MSEQADTEWLGVTFPVPMYITGEGEPYRPDAVMWFDAGTGTVVGYELVRPEELAAQAPELFRAATREPLNGPPRSPKRLRVPSQQLATMVAGAVPGVEIVVAPTPELEGIVRALCEHMAEGESDSDEPQTWLNPGVDAGDVATFFSAAARLFEKRPWEAIGLGSFVGVACEALGMAGGAMFVVGQEGPPRGFSLFWTEQAVLDFSAAMDAADDDGQTDAPVPQHIMLSFVDKSAYAPTLLAEVSQHGWTVAGEQAYPNVMVVDEDLVGRPLTKKELVAITALVDALADLAGTPELAGEDVTATRSVPFDGGAIDVTLTTPLRELEERVAQNSVLFKRVEDHLATLAEQGLEGDDTLAWAAVFTQHAIERHDALPHELGPQELEAIVFEVIPADVTCAPDQAPDAIEALRAMLTISSQSTSPGRSRQLLQALPADAAERLAARLADPKYFGPEKAIVMAAAWSGHDVSTVDGVAEFLVKQEIVGRSAAEVAREALARRKKG